MLSFSKALCTALLALSLGVKAQAEDSADYEPASRSSSKVATSWLAGFHLTTGFPLSKVSWNEYTHLTYSFACAFSSLAEMGDV
jgi:hypothetical protein